MSFPHQIRMLLYLLHFQIRISNIPPNSHLLCERIFHHLTFKSLVEHRTRLTNILWKWMGSNAQHEVLHLMVLFLYIDKILFLIRMNLGSNLNLYERKIILALRDDGLSFLSTIQSLLYDLWLFLNFQTSW